MDAGNRKIINLLNGRFQVNFAKYKTSTLNRRIQRRVHLDGFADVEEYYRHLCSNLEEQKQLFKYLLINVTQFFRDPEAFVILQKRVYPKIVESLTSSEGVRAWVAGCSTGEEAYSVAITAAEFFDEEGLDLPVKIFGTDVNSDVLEIAERGVYSDSIVDHVSEDRLSKFFTKHLEGYEICRRIRNMCVFPEHDIFSDTPLGKLDLISCRNLLIYLTPDAQNEAFTAFYDALKPRGFLFIGKSETVRSNTGMFKVDDYNHKIYSKK